MRFWLCALLLFIEACDENLVVGFVVRCCGSGLCYWHRSCELFSRDSDFIIRSLVLESRSPNM